MIRQPRTTTTRAMASVTTRIVSESRWVHRSQLEVGMYINELDRPWQETRFLFQGFRIDSLDLLHQVQESCEYASVQTDKLARVSSNSSNRLVGTARNL